MPEKPFSIVLRLSAKGGELFGGHRAGKESSAEGLTRGIVEEMLCTLQHPSLGSSSKGADSERPGFQGSSLREPARRSGILAPPGAIRPGTHETDRLRGLGDSLAERAAGLFDN
jgi:hypothetical protein